MTGRNENCPTARLEKLGLDDWIQTTARRIYRLLIVYNSDLVVPTGRRRKVGVASLEKEVRCLVSKKYVPRRVVEEVIAFLEKNYADAFVPKIHKVKDITERWSGFVEAMERFRTAEAKKECQKNGVPFNRAMEIEKWFLEKTGSYRRDGECWTDPKTGIRYWRKGNDLVWFDGPYEVHETL